MKKLLGIVLVFALVASWLPAQADILKHVQTNGEIQVLGTWDTNMLTPTPAGTNPQDARYSQTSVRVLYGVHAGLTQDVRANLTFAYYNMWGTDVVDNVNPALNPGTAGKSLQGYLNDVTVNEANVELFNLFCSIDAKIGRQFYGNEDSAVMYFGPNHYNSEQNMTRQALALDAVNFSHEGDTVSWNFIYGKLYDPGYDLVNPLAVPPASPYAASNLEDNDTALAGLDLTAAVNDNLKVQAYIYNIRTKGYYDPTVPGFVALTDYVGFWGIKPTYENDSLKASVEYARNFAGERFLYDVNSDMVKVDLGLKTGDITPRAQYYRNHNGFYSFGNYRPGLIFGQLANNASLLPDTTVWNVGADANFPDADKLTFSVDLFGFQPVDKLSSWNAFEGDFWVKYAQSKNVELHAAIGTQKIPGNDRWPVKIQSGMLVRF